MTKDALRAALSGMPYGSVRVRATFMLTRKSQADAGRRLGVSQSLISQIATGRREATEREQKALARFFGLDSADLFGVREGATV
jgi:transcriptional regulator with XRE-family HTH domain